jgi:hypothetical protein
MADGNLQPTSNDPLENNQWQEQQWAEQMAYAKATVAQQGAEAEEARAAAAAKAEQESAAAEEEDGQDDGDGSMAAKLAMARNRDRRGGANADGDSELADFPELKKKADAISKKIKEEKKKTGAEYFTAYLFLTLAAALVDVVDLICDLFGVDVGIVITPIYSTMRYLGIKYANMGMTSKEHEKMALIVTLISGAISAFGLPSNTAAMFMEFAARKKIANDAAAEIKKLEGQRDKLLGPMKNQYQPGK